MDRNLELIKGFIVYEYTFLDELSFIQTPQAYLDATSMFDENPQDINEVVAAVRERFLGAGWEGDGDIGVIWLPPFVDVGVEDTWGTYVWHVKQSNNGISFLLSPTPLNFQRIKEQNYEFGPPSDRGIAVSIVHHDVDHLCEEVGQIKLSIQNALTSIQTLSDPVVAQGLSADILAHKQGLLVQVLQAFLDNCYLAFLIEAMNGNRSKIKLRKSRVQLSPPRDRDDDLEDDRNSWFTVQGVISDMWRAYKFEPYRSKIEMLFKSVDFDLDHVIAQHLAKHVLIRNCIQHHAGHLDSESLPVGMAEPKIKSSNGEEQLMRGRSIVLYQEELIALSESLVALATKFNEHVWKRVPSRYYVTKKVK